MGIDASDDTLSEQADGMTNGFSLVMPATTTATTTTSDTSRIRLSQVTAFLERQVHSSSVAIENIVESAPRADERGPRFDRHTV